MKLIYLKSALKFDSWDVAIGNKIPFFRVLVTIESGRSLLQFVITKCLNKCTVTCSSSMLLTTDVLFVLRKCVCKEYIIKKFIDKFLFLERHFC